MALHTRAFVHVWWKVVDKMEDNLILRRSTEVVRGFFSPALSLPRLMDLVQSRALDVIAPFVSKWPIMRLVRNTQMLTRKISFRGFSSVSIPSSVLLC